MFFTYRVFFLKKIIKYMNFYEFYKNKIVYETESHNIFKTTFYKS